ncbi:MAG: class II aldolase/adducin family protein [Betaproteobacteria bacterium]|nr:class II aldolase/adducin family protein [Betaproteobacteria bacterium]
MRCDLAACYRLVAMFGWDDLVFTHISARVPGADHHFLINPYGMMFDEISASHLVKVDRSGHPVIPAPYPVNPAGFVIHSAIHEARDDVLCVLHTHTTAGVAVAAQAQGLLPISQQASVILPLLAYHDYEGLAVRDDEKQRLQSNLGSKQALILRNHGLLTVGASMASAFLLMFTLERACQIQIAAQSGAADLQQIRQHILDGTEQAVLKATAGMDASVLVWPALLRRLNRLNPGYDQ